MVNTVREGLCDHEKRREKKRKENLNFDLSFFCTSPLIMIPETTICVIHNCWADMPILDSIQRARSYKELEVSTLGPRDTRYLKRSVVRPNEATTTTPTTTTPHVVPSLSHPQASKNGGQSPLLSRIGAHPQQFGRTRLELLFRAQLVHWEQN